MGGTGDGRPRGGAAPPSAHTVCGAGGGRGQGPATPSTQHRREGVGLFSKGTERAASCFARILLPCQMEAGRPPPGAPAPASSATAPARCRRSRGDGSPRSAGLRLPSARGRPGWCSRGGNTAAGASRSGTGAGAPPAGPAPSPAALRCAPLTWPAPRGQPEHPDVPTALPGRAEGSRTFLTKTPRTRPLRVMPAQGAYGQGHLGWDSGRPSLGAAPWPTSPSVQLPGRGPFPFPAGQGQTAHASRSADGAASIFTAAEPGPSRPRGLPHLLPLPG